MPAFEDLKDTYETWIARYLPVAKLHARTPGIMQSAFNAIIVKPILRHSLSDMGLTIFHCEREADVEEDIN